MLYHQEESQSESHNVPYVGSSGKIITFTPNTVFIIFEDVATLLPIVITLRLLSMMFNTISAVPLLNEVQIGGGETASKSGVIDRQTDGETLN